MSELRKQVHDLLKDYRAERQKADLLRYELEHPVYISAEDVLETMAFSKGKDSTRPQMGHISDKTYYIAMNYCMEASRLSGEVNAEIADQLERLSQKLSRLEHCVAQLQEEHAAVIRGLYFEGKAQKELQEELHLSESSVKRYRNKALDELVAMYQTIQQAGVTLNW